MSQYAKAFTAALIAALTTAAAQVDDGLTTGEVLGIAAAALTAGAGVFAVPNRPQRAHRGAPQN